MHASKRYWQSALKRPRNCVSPETRVSARCKKMAKHYHSSCSWSILRLYSKITKGRTRKLIHGLAKQMGVCVRFVALWSQNASFRRPQSCQFLNRSLLRPLRSWISSRQWLKECYLRCKRQMSDFCEELTAWQSQLWKSWKALNVDALPLRMERFQLRCFEHVARTTQEKFSRPKILDGRTYTKSEGFSTTLHMTYPAAGSFTENRKMSFSSPKIPTAAEQTFVCLDAKGSWNWINPNRHRLRNSIPCATVISSSTLQLLAKINSSGENLQKYRWNRKTLVQVCQTAVQHKKQTFEQMHHTGQKIYRFHVIHTTKIVYWLGEIHTLNNTHSVSSHEDRYSIANSWFRAWVLEEKEIRRKKCFIRSYQLLIKSVFFREEGYQQKWV